MTELTFFCFVLLFCVFLIRDFVGVEQDPVSIYSFDSLGVHWHDRVFVFACVLMALAFLALLMADGPFCPSPRWRRQQECKVNLGGALLQTTFIFLIMSQRSCNYCPLKSKSGDGVCKPLNILPSFMTSSVTCRREQRADTLHEIIILRYLPA